MACSAMTISMRARGRARSRLRFLDWPSEERLLKLRPSEAMPGDRPMRAMDATISPAPRDRARTACVRESMDESFDHSCASAQIFVSCIAGDAKMGCQWGAHAELSPQRGGRYRHDRIELVQQYELVFFVQPRGVDLRDAGGARLAARSRCFGCHSRLLRSGVDVARSRQRLLARHIPPISSEKSAPEQTNAFARPAAAKAGALGDYG